MRAWPDVLAHLISAVRSGRSLGEACESVGEDDRNPLHHAFSAFARTYRATGSFEEGLTRLTSELSDPIGDRVGIALAVAHDVGGGDLVRILRTSARAVRDDLRARDEIEARWAWTKTAARLSAAAPWIVLAVMSVRPEAADAYGSPQGVVVLIGGAVATVAGYRLMLRAARLPVDRRLGG
jgi:tight adherence protein B